MFKKVVNFVNGVVICRTYDLPPPPPPFIGSKFAPTATSTATATGTPTLTHTPVSNRGRLPPNPQSRE